MADEKKATVTMFFPREIKLRMRDQSLLTFPAGPQQVPADLPEEEKAILVRQGVKPIAQASKQAIAAAELAHGAPRTDADIVRDNALQAKAAAQSGEKTGELSSEEKAAQAKAAADAKAKAESEAKAKADADAKAKAEAKK